MLVEFFETSISFFELAGTEEISISFKTGLRFSY